MNNLEKELPKEMLPETGLTFEESEFLHECDMYETYQNGKLNAITIITENEKGVMLSKWQIKRLIEVLTKYIKE